MLFFFTPFRKGTVHKLQKSFCSPLRWQKNTLSLLDSTFDGVFCYYLCECKLKKKSHIYGPSFRFENKEASGGKGKIGREGFMKNIKFL